MAKRVYAIKDGQKTVTHVSLVKLNHDIYVAATDENGKPLSSGYLVQIRADGITRLTMVNKNIGLSLGEDGAIREGKVW